MIICPTFYFRRLSSPIVLSYTFNIVLRNPKNDELQTFQQSVKILSSRLSDKERRKILYTLYPLGNFNAEGSLEEQFIRELSSIWVLATTDYTLPFENSLVDYGFLCGYIVDKNDMMNPSGFITDIKTLTPRSLLRALKKELPKAAEYMQNPNIQKDDLLELEKRASGWDGLLTQSHTVTQKYSQLAKTLREAYDTKNIPQKFIKYCIAAEILLVHNPSKSAIKSPINQQFSNKLTLIRHIMISKTNQNILHSPIEMQQIFNNIYELRSQLLHGHTYTKISNKILIQHINLLHVTVRLLLELQTKDPLLIEFLYRI